MAVAAGVQSIDLLTNFRTVSSLAGGGPVGITIKRIRISIQIDFDLTVSNLSRDTGAWITTLVETAGLASANVPTAVANPDKDYPFRTWLAATGGLGNWAAGGLAAFNGQIVVSREYDARSMRRLRDLGDTVYLSVVPTGGGNCGWHLEASTLLLLP